MEKEPKEQKEPIAQVEPSNVAPSQTGQQGIVGVGKPEAAEPGTNQEAAELIKSPNPEEPSPQVPADPGKPAATELTGEVEDQSPEDKNDKNEDKETEIDNGQ